MSKSHFVQTYLACLIVLASVCCSGCSILSPIGNAISQGYENTVTYFNSYYNANRIFNEAEDEVITAARLARGKTTAGNQQNQIPASAKQKFTQVIDKCSNILAFHSTSTLVDDALFLIGKSFYYQSEYLKAERKFAELLAQYPTSSLALEAQLWLERAEEKLNKLEESIALGKETIATSKLKDDKSIEVQVHLLLGSIYRQMKQYPQSITEYENVVSISSDDEVIANAQVSLGDLYFEDKQYQKAIDEYSKVPENTSDLFLNYYSNSQIVISLRLLGEYDKCLEMVNSLIDDFRNKDYRQFLQYERANIYAANGRLDDAIQDYIIVDTTYPRTPQAIKSAYALGQLYENTLGNYQLAHKYYSELSSATSVDGVEDGKRKIKAFSRYFDARQKNAVADSLLTVLQDTVSDTKTDTLVYLKKDTVTNTSIATNTPSTLNVIDTLSARISSQDSIQSKKNLTQQKSKLPSADSINSQKSIAAQDLGDVFYSEIINPDSAYYWYNQSLKLQYHKLRSPRILYILAELSRSHPEKKFPTPEEYYTQLEKDFPESIYADEARRFLGRSIISNNSDPIVEQFAQAEKQIDAKQFEKAVYTLRNIIHKDPKSALAAKSEYAIGWIQEYCLAQPESALVSYKQVVQNYAGTPFALIATKRTTEVKKDSVVPANNLVSQDSTSSQDEKIPQNDKSIKPKVLNDEEIKIEKKTQRPVNIKREEEKE
jgi:tetratricopeptide (TPR) repeat protein